MRLLSTPLQDVIALACFLVCWLGFGIGAKWLSQRRPSLISAVGVFRERWMRRICRRDTHIADATLLSNLLRGALFFASTTVFILGGLIALLGMGPKMAEVVAQMPHSVPSETWMIETKALIVIGVYVYAYAFFKFTWSAWQYNVLSIMVGAAPTDSETSEAELSSYVESAARIASLAGDSYNNGIRAYYFSIPLMAWFVDPRLFLAVTLVVAYVLYRREFASNMLATLQSAAKAPA